MFMQQKKDPLTEAFEFSTRSDEVICLLFNMEICCKHGPLKPHIFIETTLYL